MTDAKTLFVLRGVYDELEALTTELKDGGLPTEALQRVRSAIAQARTAVAKMIADEDASQQALAARHLERAAEVISDATLGLDGLEEGLEGDQIAEAFQAMGWEVPVSEAAAYYFDLDGFIGELAGWEEELLGARKALLGLTLGAPIEEVDDAEAD